MSSKSFKIHYRGSLFWLIFWIIVFFPIGLILLFANGTFQSTSGSHRFHYKGSIFWLIFWIIFFFPVAIVLLLVNGFSITSTEH
ncbi:MAG: hypothetical protein L0207_04920 [Chlamydiae bacterium]|nr:hypothetical protein [Chlamydiota bacterium]